MPNCPRCKTEINLLEETALQEIHNVFRAGCERKPNSNTHRPVTGWQLVSTIFRCPCCHKVLFKDEDKANDFLLGTR